MSRHFLIVLSNPTPGNEDEYRKWYVEKHIPDVVRVPGFLNGKLLPASSVQVQPEHAARWGFMAKFEIESDDLQATITDMTSRLGTEDMPLSDSFDMDSFYITVFDEV